MKRTLSQCLDPILKEWRKMVFISGPRQVGKTTLAEQYAQNWGPHLYFNWDDITDQKKLSQNPYFFEHADRDPRKPFLVILDEIHKYNRWRNYLKGAYDKYHEDFRFLVTGSSRLDLFKKGGDSLLGRYFSLPLFPLTLGEVQGHFPSYLDFKEQLNNLSSLQNSSHEIYSQLMRLSGFPDPFLKARDDFYNLWFQERKTLLIREDIRLFSQIREISLLEMLSHLIPERVGSPLSINSLKEDIGVAFETVRDWIQLLHSFYYLFSIKPFARSLKRALKKEPKVYLYDWVEVPSESARFENLVALHLLKAVQPRNTKGEGILNLCYLRDKEKREVDFCIVEKQRPILLVECKLSDENLAPTLVYYQEKLNVPVAVQLVHQSHICKKLKEKNWVRWIVSADHWLQILP